MGNPTKEALDKRSVERQGFTVSELQQIQIDGYTANEKSRATKIAMMIESALARDEYRKEQVRISDAIATLEQLNFRREELEAAREAFSQVDPDRLAENAFIFPWFKKVREFYGTAALSIVLAIISIACVPQSSEAQANTPPKPTATSPGVNPNISTDSIASTATSGSSESTASGGTETDSFTSTQETTRAQETEQSFSVTTNSRSPRYTENPNGTLTYVKTEEAGLVVDATDVKVSGRYLIVNIAGSNDILKIFINKPIDELITAAWPNSETINLEKPTGTFSGTNVNIRVSPSITADTAGSLSTGTDQDGIPLAIPTYGLPIKTGEYTWLKIKPNGVYYYVAAEAGNHSPIEGGTGGLVADDEILDAVATASGYDKETLSVVSTYGGLPVLAVMSSSGELVAIVKFAEGSQVIKGFEIVSKASTNQDVDVTLVPPLRPEQQPTVVPPPTSQEPKLTPTPTFEAPNNNLEPGSIIETTYKTPDGVIQNGKQLIISNQLSVVMDNRFINSQITASNDSSSDKEPGEHIQLNSEVPEAAAKMDQLVSDLRTYISSNRINNALSYPERDELLDALSDKKISLKIIYLKPKFTRDEIDTLATFPDGAQFASTNAGFIGYTIVGDSLTVFFENILAPDHTLQGFDDDSYILQALISLMTAAQLRDDNRVTVRVTDIVTEVDEVILSFRGSDLRHPLLIVAK